MGVGKRPRGEGNAAGELVRTLMAFPAQTPIFKQRGKVEGERDVSYVEPEQPAELYLAESLVLVLCRTSLAAFGDRLSPGR